MVIPNLVFLTTWMRPWIGLPALLVVVICTVFLVRQNQLGASRRGLDRINFAFVLGLAFFWTLFAGAGGFLPQETDYVKHNLVYHDLIHYAWPVIYALPDGGSSYLCYGLGYYLTPALGGRIAGEAIMPALTFLWLFAGMALFFYWIATFSEKPKTSLVLFLFFAPTSILFLVLKYTGIPGLMDAPDVRSALWQLGLHLGYHDPFTQLLFQPQHGIVAWLGTALLYETIWVKKDPRGAGFIWSVCLLWSPMTCLGLLLVPLAALRLAPWRAYFSLTNILGGGILLAVMGIYFKGHKPLETGFLWNLAPLWEWVIFYFLFVGLELSPVILLFLIDRKYRVLGEFRPLFLVAAGFLLLLPFLKIGHCGDLMLEAGSPALVLSALGAIRFLIRDHIAIRSPLVILFIGCLWIGAVYPICRPWVNLMTNKRETSYASTVKNLNCRNLSEYKDPAFDVAAQYLGQNDSVAVRWLLRQPEP